MTDVDRSGHRARLLQGMSAAVAEKGYAAVTIADVVRLAGVSRRTFYEHFSAKEECLLACYREAALRLEAGAAELMASPAPAGPAGHVGPTLELFLDLLDAVPMARMVLTELPATGPAARRLRRDVRRAFAETVRRAASSGLDREQALALVGGVLELARAHAEDDPHEPFSVLRPAVLRFAGAVLTPPSASLMVR